MKDGTPGRDAAARWQPFNRFNCFVLAMVAVLAPIELVLAKAVRIVGLAHILDGWVGLLLLSVCLYYSVTRPLPKLIQLCEILIGSTLLLSLLPLLTLIASRSGAPLMDAALSAIDAKMHFNTAAVVHAVALVPMLPRSMVVVYGSLTEFVLAALVAPLLFGRFTVSCRCMLAVVFAAIVTAIVFSMCPAIGPWAVEDIQPSVDQVAVDTSLETMKSGVPVQMKGATTAIVSFPSFHVALAILSAIYLSTFRRLRIANWILATLITISTVTTGWHYGIDVIGGIVLAAVSAGAAEWAGTWMFAARDLGLAGRP